MKVLLLGATGFSGRAALQKLLHTEHQVTVITRSLSSISSSSVTILEGNVLDLDFMNKVLKGQDAVINCLGIGGKGNGQHNTFLSDSMRILTESMKKNKVNRLIGMSNIGAGDSVYFHPWLFRKIILPYFMSWLKAIIDDKNRLEVIVQNSSLDWTLVRLPNIVDKPPKKTIHTTFDGKRLRLSITNEDTAQFLVEQLSSLQYLHQIPSISN